MSHPSVSSGRLNSITPPEERYYLFWLGLPVYDKDGELDSWSFAYKAILNSDYAFIRISDEHVPYVEFKVLKNRSGIVFDQTPEFAWLKSQFPSIQYFYSLKPGVRDGIIRVSDARDLILIKVLHDEDKCLNRFLHSR